ncbi:hypothetical protein BDV98DRAFT_596229 [Pterulicium gracile]|uniref:Uncharacterized protein n=1 Tax=Pterulicium gracile TaxID=1884261 RepID=A0A5C3Q7K6_9AGAR|nr:hypothetical protein BDV98DRAFT_596229 [Pterula gracilis]
MADTHKDGEQKNVARDDTQSHQSLDTKDSQTIANKLAKESIREKEGNKDSIETQRVKEDPTLPARAHGNEPSRGAKIDAAIEQEEQEYLERKGKA